MNGLNQTGPVSTAACMISSRYLKLPTFTYLYVISDYSTHHHVDLSHKWWWEKRYYTADSKDKISCQYHTDYQVIQHRQHDCVTKNSDKIKGNNIPSDTYICTNISKHTNMHYLLYLSSFWTKLLYWSPIVPGQSLSQGLVILTKILHASSSHFM